MAQSHGHVSEVPNKGGAPRMDATGSSFRGTDRGAAKQKSREMQKILQLLQQYEATGKGSLKALKRGFKRG